MSKDEKETPAEAPKRKSKKLLMIIAAVAVVVLGGGGGGAYFLMSKDKAPAAPTKGIVTPLTDALTINLADGHYLKLNFAIQETADAGTTAVDPAEAINAAIDIYTGSTVAVLSTAKGRETAKSELLTAIEKSYNTKDSQLVMGIYYTSFVTQ